MSLTREELLNILNSRISSFPDNKGRQITAAKLREVIVSLIENFYNIADDEVVTKLDAALAGALPLGGTTGQVLMKSSAEDFQTSWVDPGLPSDESLRSKFSGSGLIQFDQDTGVFSLLTTLLDDLIFRGNKNFRIGDILGNDVPNEFSVRVGTDQKALLRLQDNSLNLIVQDKEESPVFDIAISNSACQIRSQKNNYMMVFSATGIAVKSLDGQVSHRIWGGQEQGDTDRFALLSDIPNPMNVQSLGGGIVYQSRETMPAGGELFRLEENGNTVIHVIEREDALAVTEIIPTPEPADLSSVKFLTGSGMIIPVINNPNALDNLKPYINGELPDLSGGSYEIVIAAFKNGLSVAATPLLVLEANELEIKPDFQNNAELFQDIPVRVTASDVRGGTEGNSEVIWYTHSSITKSKLSPQSPVLKGEPWNPPVGVNHKYAHCEYILKDEAGKTVKTIESDVISFTLVSVIVNDRSTENGIVGVLDGLKKGYDNSDMEIRKETVDGKELTVQVIQADQSPGIIESEINIQQGDKIICRYYYNTPAGKIHRQAQFNIAGTNIDLFGNGSWEKVERVFEGGAGQDELGFGLQGSAHSNVTHKIAFMNILKVEE